MKKRLKKKRYVVKIGNSGFTLIELLAVVAILAVVASIVIYFSLRVVNDANEKSYATTINNIENEANNYILENGDGNSWMPTDVEDNQYQCVTVQNLIDIGYFKSDVLKSKVDKNTYVDKDDYIYVERNKNKVITKSVLLVGDDVDTSYLNRCKSIPVVTKYTITYAANGGYKYNQADAEYCTYEGTDTSGEMSNTVCVYGEDCTLNKVKFERNCHEFLGWSTNPEATVAEYKDGATFAYNTEGNITLYAVWKNAHIFSLAGTQLVSGQGQYECGHVHDYAYANYCSKCQMSAVHYRKCYLKDKWIPTQTCPCNWSSGRVDDAVLYTKDKMPHITRYKTTYLANLGTSYISSKWIRYHGGINEGDEKLAQYNKLNTPRYCEQHK